MAATYFSPKRLFMKREMEQFKLSTVGKHATQQERRTQRIFLKQQFEVLPEDVMEVYKTATPEKMAMHGFIEEAIVNTLNDNCEQSFRHLSKHVSGWCSYNIERWLQSHESYASYLHIRKISSQALPKGTYYSKTGQFLKTSAQSTGATGTHEDIVVYVRREVVIRSHRPYLRQNVSRVGIRKKSFSAHHYSHINKV
jgi:hypothetical protein